MDGVQGLVLCGRFRGVFQKTYGDKHPTKAGQDVPGMFEARIAVDKTRGTGEFIHHVSFFWEDFEGDLTPFARSLDKVEPKDGDQVVVRVRPKTDPGSQYVNLDPISVQIVDPAQPLHAVETA